MRKRSADMKRGKHAKGCQGCQDKKMFGYKSRTCRHFLITIPFHWFYYL